MNVIANGDSLLENVSLGEFAEFKFTAVGSGSYDVEVRPNGSEDAVLSRTGIGFDGATAYTVFATGTLADESLDATIASDYVRSEADDRIPAAHRAAATD